MYASGGGATAIIKHNASTIFSQAMNNNTTDYPYSETEVMLAGEYIDFILDEDSVGVNNNTILNPSIAFTTDGTTPANPVLASLTSTASLDVGTVTNLTLNLSSQAIGAASVSLESSDATKATVPATVTVPSGGTSVLVPVTAIAAGSTTITASYNDSEKTSAITVTTPVSGGVWTNLPSGMTLVTDCPFSGGFPSGQGWYNVYNTFPFAAPSISGTPFSSPHVLDVEMAAGSGYGNGEWGVNFTSSREVYMGMYWATNSGFQGYINNNNKTVFIRNHAGGCNSFLVWQGGQDQPKTLKWYQQDIVNNTHIPTVFNTNYPTDGTGWFEPNINSTACRVSAGSGWHFVEVYLKASTTASSQDGIVKWWVDRTLCGSYNNVNASPSGYNEFVITPTWDNQPNANAPYRDMSRAWHHYYDHVYIARRA
jgi:hypothetical protein